MMITDRKVANGLRWIVILVAVVAMTSTLVAQDRGRGRRGGRGFGGGGGMQMFEPEYLRRDLPLFVDELDLDDMQGTIVQTLLLDYQSAFDEAVEETRPQLEALRPEDPEREARQQEREEIRQAMRTIRDDVRKLRERSQDGEVAPEVMEAVQEKLTAARERSAELRPRRPQGEELERMMEGMTSIRGDWRKRHDALTARFLSDLRLVLNEEQTLLWPEFERTLRRNKTLGRGRYAGESVDLLLVLRDLHLPEDTLIDLEPVISAYTLDLDRALVSRNEFLETSRNRRMEAMVLGDTDRAIAVLAEESQLRTDIRDVNDRFADAMAETLVESRSEQTASDLRQAYLDRAFPRVFRRTAMQRGFDVIRSFEELDSETREAMAALEQSFGDELGRANDEIMRITRDEEPSQDERRIEQWARRMSGDRTGGRPVRRESPVREAYTTRTALEQRYRDIVEAMLTPEQIEQLPPIAEPREERRGRGFGGDDASREVRRARMIERFDTDGDGEMSEAEWEAAREERRRQFEEDGGGRGRRGGGPGGPGGPRGGDAG